MTEYRKREDANQEHQSMVDHVVCIRRVTKVTKGGKRFSFSALVVVGDQGGHVGIALGKSREVSSAIDKAKNKARKNLIEIPLRGSTIPYAVVGKHGTSKVIMRSASKGTGLIAGGSVRLLMEALGVKDILAKSVGSSNRVNVVKAALNALAKLRSIRRLAQLREKSVEHVARGTCDVNA